MAVYNGERFLAGQLDTVFGQTRKPDLVVIVDDRSTDSTLEIAQAYAKKHSNLRIEKNETNLGWIKNFEKAISLCDTDYTALCDQDDIWELDKLEQCVDKLTNTPDKAHGLCYHDSGLVLEDGTLIDKSLWELSEHDYPLTKESARSIITSTLCPVSGFSMVFSRELKELVLPLPGWKCCGHDWWICALGFFLFDPVVIERPLAHYRMHLDQASGAASMLLEGTPYAIKKKMLDGERIKRNLKRIYDDIFHSRIKKEKSFADDIDRKREFATALNRLAVIIKEKADNNSLYESKD